MLNMQFYFRCFLFLLLLVSSGSYSQLKVIDSETKQAIPYIHIDNINLKKRVTANFNGEFYFEEHHNIHDTLKFSCIGYEEKYILLKDVFTYSVIELHPDSRNLSEVQIISQKGNYQSEKLGITQKPKTRFFDFNIRGKNREEKAVWIPNTYSVSGFLKSVNIYVTDLGYPDAHFRIHVYECSSLEKRPGKELTQSNIIASGTTGNEWVTVDLTQEHILIGENGCFIGIEWFDSPASKHFSDTIVYKGNRVDRKYTRIRSGHGVVIGSRDEAYLHSKNKIWHKNITGEWVSWSIADESKFNQRDTLGNGYVRILNENNLFYQVPCINIDVSFSKEKITTVYQAPKRRKLNKIERVKEDNFRYPQSNVSELFSSLIKAFENDDIIYILRFLCVYKDNEVERIVDDITNNIEALGVTMPENEKQLVIKHLKEVKDDLNQNALIQTDSHRFKLKANNLEYNLTVKDGKWKINPYSYRIFE